jgi:UDP-2,3-diacylglucosamine pyrophosphatase LpxH
VINKTNVLIIAILVSFNLVAFLWGEYHTLMPIFYIAGFIGISIISFWLGNKLETKDLFALAVSATLLSFVDEYAHTSVGTLAYFDQAIPSPLTVFGWSVFMIFLIGITRLIVKNQSMQIEDKKKLRILPVIVSLILILAVTVLQDYLSIFNWVLILVYLFLFSASVYYTYQHSLKWNLFLMITSLILGLCMEYIGGLEGLWTFRFQDPISLLILFSWPLRIWGVNALCFAFGVDFSKISETNKINPAQELDAKKSIIVVADTHLGLKKKKQNCDPTAFSDFLDWVASLEQKGKDELNLRGWSIEKEKMMVKPPEKMVFLGDILELWDTTKESVDACSRSIIQTLSKLTCEKIYVLGNHDHELVEIAGKYPLGQSSVNIVEHEYATCKGDKKLIFLHGHQFDKFFTLPSWRIMPLFNKVATVLGKFTWFFVALFAIDIVVLGSLGFGGLEDWITLLSLGAISIPFLVVRFGRDVWNSRKTTRYKPEEAEDRVEKWWNNISKTEDAVEMNVIYGHTHLMGFRSMNIGKDKLTLFNLPSWIKDRNKKSGISLTNIFWHGFLYIDEETTEFLGWDTRKKRPFFIPKNLVQERYHSDFSIFETEQAYGELLQIDWPPELIEKWFGINFQVTGLV